MEILKKTGKILLGVMIGVANMMIVDRYCVKGKRPAAGDLPKEPVEYVNPYMGNISHLLVPTYPTVHLPNSMLRVYPERSDFTGDRLGGLPLIVTSHRGSSAFNLSPYQGDEAGLRPVIRYSYDREKIVPYRYQVYLDDANIEVDYAPSHQSAVYNLTFEKDGLAYLVFNSRNGELECDGNTVSGFQYVDKKTKVYLYAETDKAPEKSGVLSDGTVKFGESSVEGKNAALALAFSGQKEISVRYGISFISTEQARKNLEREINSYDVDAIARIGRNEWNDALGKIQVSGGSENDKTIFYTSLYRCYERPVNLSEDGKYYSAFDGKIHDDGGHSFYTDDWIWDTYRATHPLRILIDKERETDIINSYLLMAQQMGTNWMPTFPEVTGDSRRMNSNHAVATVIDAWRKGVRGFDLEKAYEAARKGIEEKTLIPWSAAPSGWLDEFYKEHGYIPALKPGEKETAENVSPWEKRQPVAVTLGRLMTNGAFRRLRPNWERKKMRNISLPGLITTGTSLIRKPASSIRRTRTAVLSKEWTTGIPEAWEPVIIMMRTAVMSIVGMYNTISATWFRSSVETKPLRLPSIRCSIHPWACPNGNSIRSCLTTPAMSACSRWQMNRACISRISIIMPGNLGRHRSASVSCSMNGSVMT